jgi:tetratricopeptide (TPR) repeat protein
LAVSEAPRTAAANFLFYARRYEESIRLLEQVLALDDRADSARSSLIGNLIAKGDYDRALVEIDKRPIQTPGSNALRAKPLRAQADTKKRLSSWIGCLSCQNSGT